MLHIFNFFYPRNEHTTQKKERKKMMKYKKKQNKKKIDGDDIVWGHVKHFIKENLNREESFFFHGRKRSIRVA